MRATDRGRPVTVIAQHVLRTTSPRDGHISPHLRRGNKFHEQQATSYRPYAAFHRFPGRGRTRRPRSGVHPARTAKISHCRYARHNLSAPVHPPATITTRHLPRTRRADTRVRPYDEIKRTMSHKPQLQTTSQLPQFRHSSQASLWARASQSRLAQSPLLVDVVRNIGDGAESKTRLLKRS